jgi:hypothetical protein
VVFSFIHGKLVKPVPDNIEKKIMNTTESGIINRQER